METQSANFHQLVSNFFVHLISAQLLVCFFIDEDLLKDKV